MRKTWVNNKTIVITGASSGMGKELVKLFINNNNCKVIGVARSKEKMEKLVEELGDKKDNFSYYLFDVSNYDAWQNFANSLTQKVDLLINNAGMFYGFENFLSVGIDNGKLIMDTNFYSVVYGCQTFLPYIDNNGGIVNICSSDALLAVAGTNYYASSKGAVKSFTQSLIGEFPKKYIACVFPGFTDTDIFRNVEFTTKEARLLKKFISKCPKISKKIYKSIIKRKKYLVVGYDAKIFKFLSKFGGNGGARLINGVLNKTKLDMFSKIQYQNKGN